MNQQRKSVVKLSYGSVCGVWKCGQFKHFYETKVSLRSRDFTKWAQSKLENKLIAMCHQEMLFIDLDIAEKKNS